MTLRCRRSFLHRRGNQFAVALVLSITWAMSWAVDGASVARGGRLFDNWILENKDRPPSDNHPEYRAASPSIHTIENSWRCVTCHGWDYKGRVEQKTGALSGEKGNDPTSLASILEDENHRYSGKLSKRDLVDLAAFLADGMVDMSSYIEPGSNDVLGDATRETTLFSTICANCHGADGHRLTEILPLGTFARRNPREALHKILNGHPGERMPPLRILKTSRIVDLVAYVQTLPEKNLSASIVRGGRLYDHWQKETGAQPPATRHPAYPKEAAQAAKPTTNWRCKECHGWDYRGRDGAYRQGPHRTGIKGIRAFEGSDPQAVIELLMDKNHRYLRTRWAAGPLDLQDLMDLANFVAFGQIDMNAFIDPQTGIAKGDPKRRSDEFNVFCAICHGKDGKALATGSDIGDVARKNPWEALHKIRNGHPDEAMPALHGLDMTILVDILSYAQTLP